MTILIIKKLPNSLKFYPEASEQWVNMAKGNLRNQRATGLLCLHCVGKPEVQKEEISRDPISTAAVPLLLQCSEKTLESLLDCKEIQPVHSKGDQPWVFFGRNDAKAETPVLWPPHSKSWLIGKDSDAGREWGQEEKGTTEDEMAGWYHRLNGCESEWTPGVGDGQGGLACCDSWGCKESDMTERLNWTEYLLSFIIHS